ncbi:TonB-dependent receptor [Pedobacter arcticus]|uniref:TonB-dependent receptor n=1 Tax=Pedobacter arcticus TaxID=752140 RepID=UPI001ED9C33E|nr:TonB-dependent receptor [Pedobacter arcticus]
MKLIFMLLLASFMHVNATSFAQKISMDKKNVLLIDVLKEIRKQSGYNILFTAKAIKDQQISAINLSNVSIDEAMAKCLNGYNLTYKVVDKNIVISEKKIENNKPVAQKAISIIGKITDDKGESLPGVSIRVKGSSIGAISNFEGNYMITVPSKTSILIFSYLGFETLEKSVGDNTIINVSLKEQARSLSQVVVIGYGEVKRGDLTGAVGELKLQDVDKAPVLSVDQALAGRIAGVSVSSNDGQPGSEMNIVIRGGNSLTQSNAPLYVIDGFPQEDPSLLNINPEDIKSLTVLKDASATAIYGSRGANGVIVIETKQSEGDNKTNVSYSSSFGAQQVANRLELMDPYEFVKYQAEANSQVADIFYLASKGKTIDDYKNVSGVNWQDYLFRNGFYQNQTASVSGGGKTRFHSSFNYANQQGPIIKTGYDRILGRLNLNHDLKNAKLYLGISYAQDKNFGDVAGSPESATYSSYTLFRTWAYRPTMGGDDNLLIEDLVDPESALITTNPIVDLNNIQRETRKESLYLNGSATFNLSKNLEFKVRGGASKRTYRESGFYNSLTSRGTSVLVGNTKGVNGLVNFTQMTSWLNENTLTYKKKVRDHSFTGLIGFTTQQYDYSRFGLTGELLPNEELGLSGLDQGIPGSNSALINRNFLLSYLARADYNYKSKYLVTLTFRSDASSKFAKENRSAYFPSAAFAWKIKNENFLNGVKTITDAKLRTSFGYTGNNRIGDFSRFSQMTLPYSSYYSFGNATPSKGVTLSTFGNEDLKWETTRQFDLGLDLALLKNRVRLTVDFYDKVTKDLLLSAPVPYTTGYSSMYKNIGSINNRGLEFSLSTDNVRSKSFQWSTDFNISFNKNKILSLTDESNRLLTPIGWSSNFNTVNLYMAEVGGPSSQFYGLTWDGVYGYDDFELIGNTYSLKLNVPTNGLSRTAIQPGDVKYKDINGDGIININDNSIIGRGLPIHSGGFNNNFKYKSFGLNVFFQWSYGNDIMNANRMYLEGNVNNSLGMNQLATYANRWTPTNSDSDLYRVGGQGPAGYYSNRILEDGSFLRLKTVNLSYTLPRLLTKRLKLTNLEVNLAAQNLVTWTNYTGLDPEVSLRNSTLTPGFDFSVYPTAKTIVLGIKTNF